MASPTAQAMAGKAKPPFGGSRNRECVKSSFEQYLSVHRLSTENSYRISTIFRVSTTSGVSNR